MVKVAVTIRLSETLLTGTELVFYFARVVLPTGTCALAFDPNLGLSTLEFYGFQSNSQYHECKVVLPLFLRLVEIQLCQW